MAKHTQTIRRQFANELFECVWPFCGIGAERVKERKVLIKDFVLSFTMGNAQSRCENDF